MPLPIDDINKTLKKKKPTPAPSASANSLLAKIDTKEAQKSMLVEETWANFRDSGFLWFVNSILHAFGWALVFEYDEDTYAITRVYPARTKYRGFSEAINSDGYRRISKWLAENGQELYSEAKK